MNRRRVLMLEASPLSMAVSLRQREVEHPKARRGKYEGALTA